MSNNAAATAYPLSWPPGRPRTPSGKRCQSRFRSTNRESNGVGGSWLRRSEVTVAAGRDELLTELRRLGAKRVIISTNIELKNDGLPYSNRRPPDDPGAAVYFIHDGRDMAFACDRWRSVGENLKDRSGHDDYVVRIRSNRCDFAICGCPSKVEADIVLQLLKTILAIGSMTWLEAVRVTADGPIVDCVQVKNTDEYSQFKTESEEAIRKIVEFMSC